MSQHQPDFYFLLILHHPLFLANGNEKMRGRGRPRPAPPPSSSPRRPPPAAFVAGDWPGGWRERSAEPKPSEVGQPAPDHGKRPTLVAPQSTGDDVGGSSSAPVVGTCPDMCPGAFPRFSSSSAIYVIGKWFGSWIFCVHVWST